LRLIDVSSYPGDTPVPSFAARAAATTDKDYRTYLLMLAAQWKQAANQNPKK
jgi:hypothetical protein